MNIKKWSYGNYSSSNYGANAMAFSIGSITIYFSYSTVVAFDTPSTGFKCCENVWSVTTGKHLNWLEPDHDVRLSRSDFVDLLDKVLKQYGLQV